MGQSNEYEFTEEKCKKFELYTKICDLLCKKWTDVSPSPCTDWNIFTSEFDEEVACKPETGNMNNPEKKVHKKLILQLRDTNANNQNSVLKTDFCQISYRLQDTFKEGKIEGAPCEFGRPELPWTDLYLAPVTANNKLAMDTEIRYKYYVDAKKIIMSLEYPLNSNLQPLLFYIGQPDTTYVDESDSRGMIVGITCNAPTAGCVEVSNTPDGVGSSNKPYSIPTMALIPVTNPNNCGNYFISDIYYGSAAVGVTNAGTSEGIRGKLDGIYCMQNSNVMTGDRIVIDGKKYYVLYCQKQGNSSFGSQALLIHLKGE